MKRTAFVSILFVFILIFLGACSQTITPDPGEVNGTAQPSAAILPSTTVQTPTPTISKTLRATRTHWPTSTRIPSPTPLPTIVDHPPANGLKLEGPYLLYSRQPIDPYPWSPISLRNPTTLIAMNADGSGQVTFTLPNEGYIARLERSFSPDGEWIVYYTGSPAEAGPEGRYHFALHVYQWKTGKDQKITDLLSYDYPDTFQVTADMLLRNEPQKWEGANLVEGLRSTFLSGMYKVAWSPDGRYLAFPGEMDGPSSDLYLYVLSTGEIRRLSDGPANIEWITWTPDSQKIFHGSTYSECVGECGFYHVAQVDGNAWDLDNVNSHGGINIFAGWVSNHQMAMYSRSNGPYGPLRYFNIDTGEEEIYFQGGVYDAAFDPIERQWLISIPYPDSEERATGLYLFDPTTKTEKLVSSQSCFEVVYVGYQDQQFTAYCGEDLGNRSLSTIYRDGTIAVPVDGPIEANYNLRWAPNRQWLVTSHPSKTQLYDSVGKQQHEFYGFDVKEIIWRPDSMGFYFFGIEQSTQVSGLYYFSLDDDLITRLDEAVQMNDSSYWPYSWIH